MTVAVDGRDVQTVPLTLRSGRLRPVVVAATPLAPRATLAAAAVRVESRLSTDVPADALTDITDVGDLEVIYQRQGQPRRLRRHHWPQLQTAERRAWP